MRIAIETGDVSKVEVSLTLTGTVHDLELLAAQLGQLRHPSCKLYDAIKKAVDKLRPSMSARVEEHA